METVKTKDTNRSIKKTTHLKGESNMKKVIAIVILSVMMTVCALSAVPKADAFYMDWSPIIQYVNNNKPDFRVKHVEACWIPENSRPWATLRVTADITNVGGHIGLNNGTRSMDNWIVISGGSPMSYNSGSSAAVVRSKAPLLLQTVRITKQYAFYAKTAADVPSTVDVYTNLHPYYLWGIDEMNTSNNRLGMSTYSNNAFSVKCWSVNYH